MESNLTAAIHRLAAAIEALSADPGRSLSIREAARFLNIAPRTVYDLCRAGRIRHSRIGKRVTIARDDLDAFRAGAVETPRSSRFARHVKQSQSA